MKRLVKKIGIVTLIFLLSFRLSVYAFSYYNSDYTINEEEFNFSILYHDIVLTENDLFYLLEKWNGSVVPIVDKDAFFVMPCEGSYITKTFFTEKEIIVSPDNSVYAKDGEKVKIFDNDFINKILSAKAAGELEQSAWPNNLLFMVEVYDLDSEKRETRVFRLNDFSVESQQSAPVYKFWKSDYKGWWISNTDGTYDTGWSQINNLWYLFGEDGYMKTGWQQYKNKWYYMDETGKMLTNATTPDGAKVGEDGAMYEPGVLHL